MVAVTSKLRCSTRGPRVVLKKFRTYDLRFAQREEELLFRASLERQIVFQCIIGPLFVLIGFVYFKLYGDSRREFIWEPDDPRMLCNVMILSGITFLGLLMAVASLRLRRGWFKWFVFEHVAVWCTGVVLVHLFFRSEWYALQAYGMARDDIDWELKMPPDPEMQLVLFMDMCLTAVCLWMPIRSCTLWVLPAIALTIFFAAAWLGSPTERKSMGNLINFSILCFFSMMGAYRQEQQNRDKWRAQHQVEAQKTLLQTQEQAVYRMLDRFCDCYMHIRQDLTIDYQSPRLSAILFTTKQQLEGSDFCQHLVSEEDRTRFAQAVRSTASETERTEMLPLHVRDGRGHEFQVHAYFACFHTAIGEPRFLVGLVEANERSGDTVPDAFDVNPQIIGHSSSGLAGNSEADLESLGTSNRDEIALTICDDEHLSILSITPSFTAMSGPVPAKASLRSWISGDSDKFEAFIQKAGNEFLGWHFDNLVLKTPAAKSLGKEFVIDTCTVTSICRLTEPFISDPDLNPNSLCFRLGFEGHQVKNASKEAKKKKQKPKMKSAAVKL